MSDDERDLELKQRVIYTLLGPAARLSLVFGLGAKQVVQWIEMAMFHETRKAGLKLVEASDLLDVSMRTVSRMSKLLKQNFATGERRHALPRRVEFILWAGPLSEARVYQALSDVDDPDEVSEALATLVDQGRVERRVGRTVTYAVTSGERQLVQDEVLARVDALSNLARNLLNAVYARFFTGEAAAFARTLTFRIRRADLPRLRALYEEQIWGLLRELDAAAEADPDPIQLDLSVVWAPYEFVDRQPLPGESP